MNLEFTKMQGCGNDYVYLDCVKDNPWKTSDKAELARKISDRHFGVGSDGLIFVNRSEIADFEMEMYNADGSRGEMCGNGIRCVAKLVYDKGYTTEKCFTIESMGSVKYIEVKTADGKVSEATVDMGEPITEPVRIPVRLDETGLKALNIPIEAGKIKAEFTGVSMGNPHAVVYMDSLSGYEGKLADMPIEAFGPDFENHSMFPARVNTEFVEITDRKTVNMRVWERGSGETFACGTGCCAVCVAGVMTGKTDRDITVNLRGGALKIRWDEHDNHVYMTGPAVTVFTGTIEV